MALTIETGEVIAGADSFISFADATALAVKYGLEFPTDETQGEQELRSAYNYLIAEYEARLQGKRVSASQTGIFPRTGVAIYGFDFPSDEIPSQAILAQVQTASELSLGNDPYQTTDGKEVSSESVSSLSVSYFQSGSDGSDLKLTAVDKTMQPLLKQNTFGNQFVVSRA